MTENTRKLSNEAAVEQAQPNKPPPHYPLLCSVRLTYAICAFIAMVMHLCMRNTFDFSVLCMVKKDEDNSNTTLETLSQFVYARDSSPSNENPIRVAWTRKQEFIIQSTFYYGYVVTLCFAGRLADKFGGKFFFIHSIIIQALIFILIPFVARISYIATMVVRLMQGLVAGFGNPALYQLFSTWAHKKERTALLSIAYGGYSIGPLIAFPLSAFFCHYNWELTFYIVGVTALIFGISCHWLVYNTLEEHPRLSAGERDYLESTNNEKTKSKSVPWKKILSSPPVYAFILTHVFHSYGIIVMTMMLPRFLREALGFSIPQMGIFAATPFLGGIISKIITVPLCTYVVRKPNYKSTLYGKIFYVLCNLLTIKLLVIIVLTSENQHIIIILMILFVGIFTDMAFSGGYWPSLLHLTPSYAGLLSGIANSFSTWNGFISPIIISAIAVQGNKTEWNYVMATLGVSYFLAAIIFGSFGSFNLQAWNKNNEEV
ncbi:PREDICTED: sialin [Rhagoletis zephyria]|uniref:sialin n=1 Tax=Rhagoletis zephyria TaxID=28612 RepID=UPI00081192D3|nr:PREDICTED: sialin [Rhagoletis zephyria]